MKDIKKVFVEKREGYNVEANGLYRDFKENLKIKGLTNVRVLNHYQIDNISLDEFNSSVSTIFSEPNVDNVYIDKIDLDEDEHAFRVEFLPGQYDQRADSAIQCLEILTGKKGFKLNSSKVIILQGEISHEEMEKIKKYYINPVESREVPIDEITLYTELEEPKDVEVIHRFINMNEEELESFRQGIGFAMDLEDLKFCQNYFKDEEKRNPTITELKVIDTYWSDHCRHTTFMTKIENVEFEEGQYKKIFEDTLKRYFESREYVHEAKEKPVCLMDMGTIMAKELKKKGLLDDLEESDEINACSIEIDVDVNGENEKWLLMFKNETHNHPTEIEPFGGAATCLGGAIRDPLSGRSYVYQAMRITGSGDPRVSIDETIQGKLPQRKITTKAMKGYSSYGNQIGLSTGYVREIYDEGYIAKRMEVGAVVGAGPKVNVVRETPRPGDLVLLVGGRTGRDGLGGAVGSSKKHDETSLYTCGSEVQKGNPPTERKIQRLFRNPEVSRVIKRCNDFGAGGVSVAIGELADGLKIELDKVPKKYEGLDGTELAISESQERMAVVIDSSELENFVKHCEMENLEVTVVATVTKLNRLVMNWRGEKIVDISREFLDTNGVRKSTEVFVEEPRDNNYFNSLPIDKIEGISEAWIANMTDLNTCSQRGLVEKFDSTIGAGTVLMPFGGKYKQTPIDGMVAKIPVSHGNTDTCSMMAYGFNPKISKWSPFHGGMYAVIESLAKIVAFGGDYRKVRLTFQEYFEKLGEDKRKWGKPFSALLGAYLVQNSLDIPSIGGKDSMSGTFNDISVPPTIISFAVTTGKASKVVSPEFKGTGNTVVLVPLTIDEMGMVDFSELDKNYTRIYELIDDEKVLSATSVKEGGIGRSISEMTFGNRIGFTFANKTSIRELFSPRYGSIILEISEDENIDSLFKGINYCILGTTHNEERIEVNGEAINLSELVSKWEEPLNSVFPVSLDVEGSPRKVLYNSGNIVSSSTKLPKPRVFIPIFPGTNCEYDTKAAFEKAGGLVETFVFRNTLDKDIKYSVEEMVKHINEGQIIAIPGGFSGGDEPDGSGKFIATVFRNPYISEAVMNLLKNRDGLMLGICNGFQALIKLGLLPYGEIRDIEDNSPTLTFNGIGCHVSTMVRTKVVSNLSPWFNNVKLGDIHTMPISHGEGRFIANKENIEKLIANGQVATQYVDFSGNPSYDGYHNPNGSVDAIEAITSPDGRILGKMGHSERIGKDILKNIPGNMDQKLFEAGVRYFK